MATTRTISINPSRRTSLREDSQWRNAEHLAASPAAIEAAWRRAAENGIPTVYLCFSSGLSSNYSTAAALLAQVKEEFPDAPLYLVDLMIGSTPEGLLVLEALRQRDSGLSAEELVEWAEQARYFVQTAFMVDDLDALHRGGRIPASVAAAGSALNVKPLLTFDTSGHLALTGAARGRKKGLKQMADFFAKEHDTQGGSPVVLIGNADCPKDAEALRGFWPNKTRASPCTAQYWCHHRQPRWTRHGVDFVLGRRPPRKHVRRRPHRREDQARLANRTDGSGPQDIKML